VSEDTEYRIERLRHRLALGDAAELGLRIEARANGVVVCGTVPDAECLDEVLNEVREELDGVPVHIDVTVASANSEPRVEEL
jgi:hypothetical protein